MSDYRTEQQAAALWRALEQKIDEKIARAMRLPTGITPGTAYGSVIFDATGRATWGGAGGGGVQLLCAYRMTTTQAITGAGHVNYNTSMVDPGPYASTGSGHWEFTAPADGYYIIFAHVRWQDTTWGASDSATFLVTLNGTPTFQFDYMDKPVNSSLNNKLRGFVVTSAVAGDVITAYVDLTSGSSKTLIGGYGEYIMVFL